MSLIKLSEAAFFPPFLRKANIGTVALQAPLHASPSRSYPKLLRTAAMAFLFTFATQLNALWTLFTPVHLNGSCKRWFLGRENYIRIKHLKYCLFYSVCFCLWF
ncbi:hypothetical protein ATANTOWER_028166 [Ataeniobius toweri]|uniref:Uncharacterized protein n=1 Tax=Ataeniobius toweri TaxID=208326 RepID=A0ABU7BL36_9TELE|nr:hypothetical protein [Ataeniobius toweri]